MENICSIKEENRIKIRKYISEGNSGHVDFYPRYIQIEHSNLCNAQCIMCNHFFLGNKGGSHLDIDVVKKLESILPYCETIMINGDGEPFLNPNVTEFIKLYSSFDVKVGTNTNLCYIPEDMWEVIGNVFEFINISCDGVSKETYELIRRNLSFDKFISNLNRLNKIAQRLRKNLDCVVMKQNVLELPQIVKFAIENGFSAVKFNKLGVNPCIGNKFDSEEYYMKTYTEKILEAIEIAKRGDIRIQFIPYKTANYGDIKTIQPLDELKNEIDERQMTAKKKFSDLSLSNDYCAVQAQEDDFDIVDGSLCTWGIERCYIDLKGNVTTCCYNTRKYMGNLYEESFEEIWNGKNYVRFREMMRAGFLPNWCQECNWIKNQKY